MEISKNANNDVSMNPPIAGGRGNIITSSYMSISSWIINLNISYFHVITKFPRPNFNFKEPLTRSYKLISYLSSLNSKSEDWNDLLQESITRSLHLPYKPYETTFARIFLFLETVELLDWRALYAIQYNIIQYHTAQHNSTQNNTIQCTIQYVFLGI